MFSICRCRLTYISIGGKHGILSQIQITSRLVFFMQEHYHLLKDVQLINERLASYLLFYGLGANFCLNLVIISTLLFRKLTTFGKIQCTIMFSCELISHMIAILPLIKIIDYLYQCDRMLFKVQNYLRKESITTKVKLLVYYELIHSKNKYYFTLGILLLKVLILNQIIIKLLIVNLFY